MYNRLYEANITDSKYKKEAYTNFKRNRGVDESENKRTRALVKKLVVRKVTGKSEAVLLIKWKNDLMEKFFVMKQKK